MNSAWMAQVMRDRVPRVVVAIASRKHDDAESHKKWGKLQCNMSEMEALANVLNNISMPGTGAMPMRCSRRSPRTEPIAIPPAAAACAAKLLKGYMNGLWAAFPDLSFEIASKGLGGRESGRRAVDHARHEYRIDDGTAAHREIGHGFGRRFHPGGWRQDSNRGRLFRFARRAGTARLAGSGAAQGDRSICVRQCDQSLGVERTSSRARSALRFWKLGRPRTFRRCSGSHKGSWRRCWR